MQRNVLSTADAELLGLTNVNIILGRNGAGKSRFLRSLDSEFATQPEVNIRYVSPERAGVFKTEGGIQNAMANDKTWLSGMRRTNQAENFKAASANLLRDIELIYLRKMSDSPSIRNDQSRNFRTDRLEQINRLLSNLHIELRDAGFVFISNSGDLVHPAQISSGESEAIALATEIMYFFETLSETKFNVLLLDEPDVHLHPDLQARLASFILRQVQELSLEVRRNVTICIATHSTPLVCALASSEFTSIGTKDFGVSRVQLLVASQQLKKVAPFFGHSLSLSLREALNKRGRFKRVEDFELRG